MENIQKSLQGYRWETRSDFNWPLTLHAFISSATLAATSCCFLDAKGRQLESMPPPPPSPPLTGFTPFQMATLLAVCFECLIFGSSLERCLFRNPMPYRAFRCLHLPVRRDCTARSDESHHGHPGVHLRHGAFQASSVAPLSREKEVYLQLIWILALDVAILYRTIVGWDGDYPREEPLDLLIRAFDEYAITQCRKKAGD